MPQISSEKYVDRDIKLPLWSAFAVTTILSFFFLLHPDYNLTYILLWNIGMWSLCGIIYLGWFVVRRKE